ncbi:MAG: type IV pilus assembly protein PilM [Actinomycetales bacterium]|nr:type IV pilus assembly protein PilM [Actinomycetales bacterium]
MSGGAGLVGLDIGTSGIRAVQVRRKGDRTEIVKAASVELPRGAIRNGAVIDQKAVVKALKQLWKRGRFSSRKVVFGLADSGVLTRQVELPWMPPKDFRAALRYQIGDALPVDLDSVEIDYHLLAEVDRADDHGQTSEFNRILIVAANKEAIATEATLMRKAGLTPLVADSAAFALIRAACRGIVPENTGSHAIADIGAEQVTVVIHEDGQPRFIRTIANLGGDTATLAVAERLGVDPESAEGIKRETGLNGPVPVIAPIAESSVFVSASVEEVVPLDPRSGATVDVLNPWAVTVISEIRNSLDYFQASSPDTPVQTLTLVGRTSQLDGLQERISTQIPVAVHTMDPLVGLTASKKVMKAQVPDTRLAVATGLALGSAS